MMTPQETAIRQHLSKDRPYHAGCGCMGPQPIEPTARRKGMYGLDSWHITITSTGPNTVHVMRMLRNFFQLTTAQVLAVKTSPWKSPDCFIESRQKDIAKELNNLGAIVELSNTKPPMNPLCPCSMAWVEEVDGAFYNISEIRSPDGITHTATLLGPVGGPYIKDEKNT